MNYRFVLAFLVLSLGAATAQTPSTLLVGSLPQHLDAARFGLRVDNGVLSGTGASVLAEAIARSHYILIGEDHLTREVPQFTTAICNLAAKQGLTGLAMEVSPEAATFMMRSLNFPDRWQQMVALTKADPDSIAFLDSRQENDMVAHCVEASHNPSFHLWGLDQNFIGSAGWLIDMMLAAHPGPGAKVALLRLKADEQRDAAAARANADVSALFLMSEKGDAEIKEAQPAIEHDGGTEVKTMFGHLATSYHTYREHDENWEHADVQRAKLLKINFRNAMNQIPPSEKSGKIIVKFGEWHLYKGVNSLHDLNLGNYIAETAEMEGQKSLYICVLGAGGKVSKFTKYGQPYHIEEDPAVHDPMYRWMAPFKAAQLPGQWTLYDLRALRYKSLGPLDSEVRRILDGYDFLIIVPKFTPAQMAE
ncbi:MAG: hypothetical protein ACRD28_07100 [Acidobacteriaceae bacterium]